MPCGTKLHCLAAIFSDADFEINISFHLITVYTMEIKYDYEEAVKFDDDLSELTQEDFYALVGTLIDGGFDKKEISGIERESRLHNFPLLRPLKISGVEYYIIIPQMDGHHYNAFKIPPDQVYNFH